MRFTKIMTLFAITLCLTAGAFAQDYPAKIVKDVAKALAAADMIEQFKKSAFEPMSMTPDEFAKFVQSERESAVRIVKRQGLSPSSLQSFRGASADECTRIADAPFLNAIQ